MTRQIVLITGGNRGLGAAMARSLAARGADVIVTSRSGAAPEILAGLAACGVRGAALPLEAGDPSRFPAFAAALAAQLDAWGAGRLDAFVLNAGHAGNQSVMEATEEEIDGLYAVHFKGPFLLTQTLAPMLADGGRILLISSGLARFAMPGRAAYGAMKGAVEVLARYMAQEFGPRGISVNAVAPGAVETDFSGGAVRDDPQINAHVARATAMGRVGLPADIGAAVAGLLTSEGNWITGQRIEVSGGQNL